MSSPDLEAVADEVTRLIVTAQLQNGQTRSSSEDLPDLEDIARKFWATEQPRLRLSYGSDCDLQKWLIHNRSSLFEPPDTMTRLMFAFGNLTEALLKQVLIDELSCHPDLEWVEGSDQKEVTAHGGILGHIDGLIRMRETGEHVLLDFKSSTSFAMKWWDEGRFPDSKWGYRHQAGNYLLGLHEEGIDCIGMIWPTYARDKSFMKTGYATLEEVGHYAGKAKDAFDAALMAMEPPQPCNPCRSKSPCRASKNGKVYCSMLTVCLETYPV